MLKGHPKGLLVAFFANMGERFGFYTMMACLVFYLQAKFNMSATSAGEVYSWFYFGIYGAALYNTWGDPIFKVVWSLIQLILIPTTNLLIYYGVGKNL